MAGEKKKVKGLVERLKDGENIVIAEGYLWEFERRGYLQMGGNVPEVVLEKPELVKLMHEEFVHAGSDVTEAFTYYAHREKMRSIGREADLERLNRTALRIAREVADRTGTLLAGDICNTGGYSTDDKASHEQSAQMFKEQVEWAVEEGCDYIIAETFSYFGEAMLALEAIKKYGQGLPAVVTLTAYSPDITLDHVLIPEACRRLEEAGAAVVGINCSRGPDTMIPLIREIRETCKGPIAALPVPFRTDNDNVTFFSFKDEHGNLQYPLDVGSRICNRSDIRKFAEEAKKIGVQYIGLCCGNAANFQREIAEVYGRKPAACKYSPDLSNNIIIGDTGKQLNKESEKVRKYSVGDFTAEELKEIQKLSIRNGKAGGAVDKK